MSSTQHRLRIECGSHGARPRVLATAVDRRHVTAEAAVAAQQQHLALCAAVLPDRDVSTPVLPHDVIVLERTVRRDRNAHREDRAPEWRSQGKGTRRLDDTRWLLVCPDARCRPATVPVHAIAAALDNGETTIDITDFQRA